MYKERLTHNLHFSKFVELTLYYERYLLPRRDRIAVINYVLCGPSIVYIHHRIKKLAEIICRTKYFSNFVFREYSDSYLYFFVAQRYKDAVILLISTM